MSGRAFVQHLEQLKKERRVWAAARAALRRSLAFPPGTYPPAMPYVEPFVKDKRGWRREAYYLVAGLYALKDGEHEEGCTLARALRELMQKRMRERMQESPSREPSAESNNIERRFLALLDADRDQIAFRLRQALGLVEDGVDFVRLLEDLLCWFSPGRGVQARWAREFYGATPEEAQEVKDEAFGDPRDSDSGPVQSEP